jgi:hypothetical protein
MGGVVAQVRNSSSREGRVSDVAFTRGGSATTVTAAPASKTQYANGVRITLIRKDALL